MDSRGGYVSKILYVKMKELGPWGGARRARPLDPPMHTIREEAHGLEWDRLTSPQVVGGNVYLTDDCSSLHISVDHRWRTSSYPRATTVCRDIFQA